MFRKRYRDYHANDEPGPKFLLLYLHLVLVILYPVQTIFLVFHLVESRSLESSNLGIRLGFVRYTTPFILRAEAVTEVTEASCSIWIPVSCQVNGVLTIFKKLD